MLPGTHEFKNRDCYSPVTVCVQMFRNSMPKKKLHGAKSFLNLAFPQIVKKI